MYSFHLSFPFNMDYKIMYIIIFASPRPIVGYSGGSSRQTFIIVVTGRPN